MTILNDQTLLLFAAWTTVLLCNWEPGGKPMRLGLEVHVTPQDTISDIWQSKQKQQLIYRSIQAQMDQVGSLVTWKDLLDQYHDALRKGPSVQRVHGYSFDWQVLERCQQCHAERITNVPQNHALPSSLQQQQWARGPEQCPSCQGMTYFYHLLPQHAGLVIIESTDAAVVPTTMKIDDTRQWHLTPVAKVQWHNRAQTPIEIFDYGKGETPSATAAPAQEWVIVRCR